jgi:hypothetical protein
MARPSGRNGPRSPVALTLFVFLAATIGYFLTYQLSNDHFDRLARARQIAVYGDVPFRDFFDPGYFLTLYASALVERTLGDNLLGELLLNVLFMATGTTLAFLLAARASRSTVWGLAAAALIVVCQPRPYDYDKILFYPLGLYLCWTYVDRPTVRSLLLLSLTTAVAGMFRYDSAVYIGAAVFATIVARHWGAWPIAARQVAGVCLAILLFASPALFFIQQTAGLDDALTQIVTYARSEGSRGGIFRPAGFDIDSTAPLFARDERSRGNSIANRIGWLPGYLTPVNAGAWLYLMAAGLPVVAVLLAVRGTRNHTPEAIARIVSYATLAELAALFVLRYPIASRIGGVFPLIAIGGGVVIGAWRDAAATPGGGHEAGAATSVLRGLAAGTGIVLLVLTTASIGAIVGLPSKANLDVGQRMRAFASIPPSTGLWPGSGPVALVRYLRECTQPQDRVLASWFVGELFFFSGRGFAAGLPVVFGDHWSQPVYQERSLRLIQQQSVPIIVTMGVDGKSVYGRLAQFVAEHYEPVPGEPKDMPGVQLFVRRGLPVVRRFGESQLPCYAG